MQAPAHGNDGSLFLTIKSYRRNNRAWRNVIARLPIPQAVITYFRRKAGRNLVQITPADGSN